MAARNRTLDIPTELARALVMARRAMSITSPPEIPESAVARAEADLEAKLPDEVVAMFAALGRDLGEIVKLTDTARREGLDQEYAAFARSDEGYWCAHFVASRRAAGPTFVGRWSTGDEDPPVDETTVSRFVRRTYGISAEPSDEDKASVDAEAAKLKVVVKKAKPAPARTVVHPKYGEGKVLREIRDTHHKLEIQFESGVKTILAKFFE
ncbi:MAG: hypothetical protein AB7S26_08580 [Sandaracinaceae bacterium]